MVLIVENSNCPLLQLEKYGGGCTTDSLTLVSAWTWKSCSLACCPTKRKDAWEKFSR